MSAVVQNMFQDVTEWMTCVVEGHFTQNLSITSAAGAGNITNHHGQMNDHGVKKLTTTPNTCAHLIQHFKEDT